MKRETPASAIRVNQPPSTTRTDERAQSAEAARRAGINVDRVRIIVFGISGMLAAFGGRWAETIVMRLVDHVLTTPLGGRAEAAA